MGSPKLSVKAERFCRLIASGRCKSQSDAYRQAYAPVRMQANAVHVKASQTMARPNVKQRIAQLMRPALAKVRVSRQEWLQKMQAFFYADVRNMFDAFGNPIEVPKLGDHEAAMVEGFEFCEEYAKVKKSDGSVDAVPTGYTKKYRLTPKLKAMLEFGKVMGWCEGDGNQEGNKPPINLTINFVKTGRPIDARVVDSPEQPPAVIPGVSFAER